MPKAYAIMSIGKKIEMSIWTQRKPPEFGPPGAFFAVLGGWLRPKAGYQFLSSSNHLQI